MILKAKKIQKIFPHPVPTEIFRDVDLEVAKGEALAIMGRSGEGKSTLLHVLGTLDAPTSGAIEIAGQSIRRQTVARVRNRHIGFIFQSFHLLDDLTALQNVMLPARIGRQTRGVEARARALLEQVGLADRAGFLAKVLSGGEKQRVAIARALCNDPDIIFADEPSGNLDGETAVGIHSLLLDHVRKRGKTLVLVTHDPELASLCDRKLVLHHKRLTTENTRGGKEE